MARETENLGLEKDGGYGNSTENKNLDKIDTKLNEALNSGGGSFVGVRATLSANQSVSDGSLTKVNFDNEKYDEGNNFDTSTSEFTVPEDGYYRLETNVSIDNTETGDGDIRVYFADGGQNPYPQAPYQSVHTSNTSPISSSPSGVMKFSSGDIITVVIRQSLGSSQEIGSSTTSMNITKVD